MMLRSSQRPWAALLVTLAGLILVGLLPAATSAGAPTPARCERARIERDLRFLASDSLAGRGLGSAGLETGLRMVAARFAALGLEPPFPERVAAGDSLAGYLQPFTPSNLPPSANVIGLLPGQGSAAARAVVLGAHVDHLGIDSTLAGDPIFNGADDNASGVAALLAIAEQLTRTPTRNGDRTVVFIAFSAEEAGLHGSRHYVEQPVMPLAETLAMINLDSIGRLRERQVYVFGTGTAREFSSTLHGLNHPFGFELIEQEGGAGAADQASFFACDIPVLHFFTGPHADYSRPSDEADRINYAGLTALCNYTAELMRYLRYRDQPLTFVSAGREQEARMAAMRQQGERRVSLGFMPDFSQEHGGVKVGPVSPNGAAAGAGLEAGDEIIAIDGETIDTLVDYTALLRTHAPGDLLILTVRRGARTLTLQAQVQARR